MHLSYPSDTTLRLHFPRKVLADLTLIFMALLGAFFTIGIALNEPFPLRFLNIFISLAFVVAGVWGIFYNSSTTLTLDAQTRTATLRQGRLRGATEQLIAFDDIQAVRVLGDMDFNTVGLILTDGTRIPIEDVQIDRAKAAEPARTVTDWLLQHGVRVDPPSEA